MDAWMGVNWQHVEEVRAKLESGADVNARIGQTQGTPLFRALSEGTPEVVELLLAHGADVDATAGDSTPLWEAVQSPQLQAVDRPTWRREKVRLLLHYGADPWRPTIGGRSPGQMALSGPLADLFADLHGAPRISQADHERQAQADALIVSYAWIDKRTVEGLSVAFITGIPADEIIHRLGVDPNDCPRVSREGLSRIMEHSSEDFLDPYGPYLLWLCDIPGGTVSVNWIQCPFSRPEIAMPATQGGLLAGVCAGGHGHVSVHVFREGKYLRGTEPIYHPGSGTGIGEPLEEERWCRFGGDAPAGSMAQCLALMTMLTGIRIDETWLTEVPKRAVLVPSLPRPTAA